MPTARQLEFESLIAPHLSSLYSTALRMTHNQNDAEDLVQDTLYKAFRAFDQYQKNTNFRAWAFRILVNTYITAYRKAIRQPQKVSYDDLEEFYLYKKLDESISLQETAKEDFLDHVPLPPSQIHPMPGGLPPEEGAKQYQEELEEFFGSEAKEFPVFDLIFLGMAKTDTRPPFSRAKRPWMKGRSGSWPSKGEILM